MGKILVVKGADFSAVKVSTVTIDTDKILIIVETNPSAGGTVIGGGLYSKGDTVTLTAVANRKFVFVKWNDGVTTASREITVGSSTATYTAEFEYDGSTALTWTQGTIGNTGTDNESGLMVRSMIECITSGSSSISISCAKTEPLSQGIYLGFAEYDESGNFIRRNGAAMQEAGSVTASITSGKLRVLMGYYYGYGYLTPDNILDFISKYGITLTGWNNVTLL